MSNDALQRAVNVAGGQKPLADKIGVSQSMVWYWLRAKKGVPGEYVVAIEEAVKGKVTRHELRPDIFPDPTEPSRFLHLVQSTDPTRAGKAA